MRYIDKTKLHAPSSYEAELKAAKLDEASILGGEHAGLTGDELFEKVKQLPSYRAMKRQLLEDQGYVCCYCNRSITGIGDITEHVEPKSANKHLVGEYKNLLVACEGGQQIPPTVVGRNQKARRRLYPLHCDQKKGDRPIPISPLSPNCEWDVHFNTLNGEVYGNHLVMETVGKLNLNHPVLKKEREVEIASLCYDGSGNVLSNEQLDKVFTKMLTRDASGHYHNLYYVIASAALSLVR